MKKFTRKFYLSLENNNLIYSETKKEILSTVEEVLLNLDCCPDDCATILSKKETSTIGGVMEDSKLKFKDFKSAKVILTNQEGYESLWFNKNYANDVIDYMGSFVELKVTFENWEQIEAFETKISELYGDDRNVDLKKIASESGLETKVIKNYFEK